MFKFHTLAVVAALLIIGSATADQIDSCVQISFKLRRDIEPLAKAWVEQQRFESTKVYLLWKLASNKATDPCIGLNDAQILSGYKKALGNPSAQCLTDLTDNGHLVRAWYSAPYSADSSK